MNFLAHLYLSGDRPKVMVGNFIGDFVKGRNVGARFEPEVALGIELHRAIDHFTDTHQVVHHSKKRLGGKYRHYSGVIIDVFFDHFLSSKWCHYHNQSIELFASRAYQTIQEHNDILPDPVKRFLPYMIRNNWLVGYGYIDGVQKSLAGIASRTVYESNMEKSVEDLREHYEDFAKDFEEFFPQLRAFVDEYLRGRGNGGNKENTGTTEKQR